LISEGVGGEVYVWTYPLLLGRVGDHVVHRELAPEGRYVRSWATVGPYGLGVPKQDFYVPLLIELAVAEPIRCLTGMNLPPRSRRRPWYAVEPFGVETVGGKKRTAPQHSEADSTATVSWLRIGIS
jgi:hypothetical protein